MRPRTRAPSSSWFFLFLALSCVLVLAGCDGDEDDGGDDTSGDTATAGDTASGDTSADTAQQDTTEPGDTNAADTAADTAEPRCELTPPAGTPTEIDFDTQILPIIEGNGCAGCHGGSGGFFATELGSGTVPEGNHGAVYVACDPGASHIVQKVHTQCEVPFGGRMPLGRTPLPESDAWLIWQWIAEGGQATFSADACP